MIKEINDLRFQNFAVFLLRMRTIILKIVIFVIEKMKLVSFSLFLDVSPPPDTICPFDNWTSLYKYTICVKGVLGLGGGGWGGKGL